MLGLRNDPSLQTNFLAFPAHFLFHTGSRAPHCVIKADWSSPRPLVLWDSVAVEHFSRSLPQQQGPTVTVGCSPHVSYLKLCCWVYCQDSHIFTVGFFAVPSQQMWIVRRWYGFCWMVLRGVSRLFNSPPDLTPFTLDKHNTKEKRRFNVGGLGLLHAGKGDSLIPLGG